MAVNVLVSACLLGVNCRYDGISKANKEVLALMDNLDIRLIPICPEQLGGLPTPRIPSEIKAGSVFNQAGEDVTSNYERGAKAALQIAKLYDAHYALLKERSPSCGIGQVYDGTFTKTLIDGDGITAALFSDNDILVYGESEIEEMLMVIREEMNLFAEDEDDDYLLELLDEELPFTYSDDDEYLYGEPRAKKNSGIHKAGKNHIRVDGKLLQTNKKYSALKSKQKEKISLWMKEEIERYYERTGKLPWKGRDSEIVSAVYDRIQGAQIWIPFGEVAEQFSKKKHKMIKSVQSKLEKQDEVETDSSEKREP